MTNRETRQQPAKATEDKRLDEPDNIEKLPPLDSDAVAGHKDGDRTVDSHRQGED